MHDVGRNVDHRPGLGLDWLAADGCVKHAVEYVDPLFVGMRMCLSAGAGRHPHQCDDHAIALDASAVRGRIVRAAENVIDAAEIEQVFAGAGALGAGGAGRRA